jgi:hypothetical protein
VAAPSSPAPAPRDSLDAELARLGLLPADGERSSGVGGGGGGVGIPTAAAASTGRGSNEHQRLRTSVRSFAARLAAPAVPPPLGLGAGLPSFSRRGVF